MLRTALLLFLTLIARAEPLPIVWESGNDTGPLRKEGEELVVPIKGGDPFLLGPTTNAPLEPSQVFQARLFTPQAGYGQLFCFKEHASEDKSFHFALRAGWNDIEIPLPAMPAGWRLRLDLPALTGDCVLGAARVATPSAEGIVSITPGETTLAIEVTGAPLVEIFELLPHQSLADQKTAKSIWRGAPRPGSGLEKIPRFDGKRDRLTSGFLAKRLGEKRPLGGVRYAQDAGKLARDQRPYPTAKSKKGLQFQELPDALALGLGHATINVSIGALLDPAHTPGNPTRVVDGQRFTFKRSYLDTFPVKQLSDAGVLPYLILIGYRTGKPEVDRLLLHPNCDDVLPNGIAAFNTSTDEGTRAFRAICEFLADWYSRENDENGRVAGFIIGNEVNAHWHWYNFGPLPPAVAVAEYERALRIAHTAIRSVSANARVYASFTHHWTARAHPQELGTRYFLDHLARLTRMGGDYDWRVAQHPYSVNMFEPRFWKEPAATSSVETTHVTFQNLSVLSSFLAQEPMKYRGTPRTILLSEQGFHTDNTPAGDDAQAAAYCFAWKKVAQMPEVEAFILHRHVDHKMEGGLNLGLWRRQADSVHKPEAKRKMYECFQAAATPAEEEAFRFALPIVGLEAWPAVPAKK